MKILNRFNLLLVGLVIILFSRCQDQLEVVNPNEPTLEVLDTEEGIKRTALGVYVNGIDINYLWYAQGYHEVMGDAIYIPWGNFGWRWANQPTSITLDNGRVWTPPQEGAQGESLKLRNTRAFGTDNAFQHEWLSMYSLNNSCNLILMKLDEGNIEFTGNAASKEKALRAWAHWWKGYAYSRIGSMYSAGLIIDTYQETNNNFLTNEEVLAEANNQFDKAIEILNTAEDDAGYAEILTYAIPDFTIEDKTYPSPAEWVRNINTMKARNILVNNRAAEMSDAQWNEIIDLANSGLQPTDFVFLMKQDNVNFLGSGWVNPRMLMGWHFISERLVQDFKAGDARFDRNVVPFSAPRVNQSGRGIQYGTRWNVVDIVDGGDWVSLEPGVAKLYLAGSYEENQLMKAEALINTTNIQEGLGLVDEIRDYQDADLDAVASDINTFEEAFEEVRRERRIGLFLRGLPFYDARRWGVTDPAEQGGGRDNVVVLDEDGTLHTEAFINYNYLNYWGVPENELVFNGPAETSPSVEPK